MGAKQFAAILICCLLGSVGVLQILGNGGLVGWLLAGFFLLAARFYFQPRPGELALVGKCVAALIAFVAVLVAAVFAAWESGEVVVLRYTDDRNTPVEARLWVIDLEGGPVVAMGSGKKRVALIQANPHVELVRAGRVECRRAAVMSESEATQEERRTAERLFEEKYGLRLHATRLLALVFGAPPGEEPVGIRLEPCADAGRSRERLLGHCVARLERARIPRCNLYLYNDNAEGMEFWAHNGWSAVTTWQTLQKRL